MKPKVCIISFSNIAWDARVLREVEAASREFEVDVIGYGKWDGGGKARFFSLPRTTGGWQIALSKYTRVPLGYLFPQYWEAHYWLRREYKLALDILLKEKYDLIHANDWQSLPIVAQAAQKVGSKVLFDAHEYVPSQRANELMVRLFHIPVRVYLIKTYQNYAAKTITVSDGLRNLYHENFGWNCEVIMNVPYYVKNDFRPANPNEIQIIHHGGAMPGRHLEDFISLAALLDSRYKFNFMLMPSNLEYLDGIKSLADRLAHGRVIFHAPVLPRGINEKIVQFDIGIPFMHANTLNIYNALPNKFFDYVMAGLAIVVPPLPSMQKIVERNKMGAISADQSIQSMAKLLNSLSVDEINQFKRNALLAAKTLNADVEMKKLIGMYKEILSADPS